jgi:uncharacterized protein YbbK (DUF523 family)
VDTIRLGISSCLLGEEVRYDGGHKLDRYLRDTLGRLVELVPVCPEVECGLPVPREPMHLMGDPDAPRLITVRSGRDLTEQMERWAKKRAKELAQEGLSGFVLKARSPSCGIYRVQVYDEEGVPQAGAEGSGIFVLELRRQFPQLPLEDEGRLSVPELRESFIKRLGIA